jgi:hypothetical protein
MWRHPIFQLLLLTYIGWGAWNWIENRPVSEPDGILVPGEPLQVDVLDGETRRSDRWTLKVRAHYEVTARILGLERYRFDALAGLVPEDLALGWGPMSDNRILRSINISQSNRFYFWRADADVSLSRDAIIAHSANTHVIPENTLVARQLSHLRRGAVVKLTGDLVDGVRDDGASIKTSLVRTDTGAGSCELMLVREVAVVH